MATAVVSNGTFVKKRCRSHQVTELYATQSDLYSRLPKNFERVRLTIRFTHEDTA